MFTKICLSVCVYLKSVLQALFVFSDGKGELGAVVASGVSSYLEYYRRQQRAECRVRTIESLNSLGWTGS